MRLNFQPIWISTIGHMDEHARITQSTSLFGQLLGRSNCPDSFPHLKLMPTFLNSKVPLVYFQHGEVSVEESVLGFVSTPPKSFGARVRGDFPELKFQLRVEQVTSVEPYRYPTPYMKWANLNWVRIRTTEDVFGGDLLMCVGGISTETVNQQTANLMSAVEWMRSSAKGRQSSTT